MAVHDWTRVDAGLFHAFHHRWIDALCDQLNSGTLPREYFALPEQNIKGPIPDILTLKIAPAGDEPAGDSGGVAVATAPPRTRVIQKSEVDQYAELANHITVRHRHGDVVAVIEIVSPGNKGSRAEFKVFIEKAIALLRQRIHLLVVDLFPPGPRDPQGVHKAIWEEFQDTDLKLPEEKPLTVAAYDAGPPRVAYVEAIRVGEPLPEMPLFLRPGIYVPVPLESTYQTSWTFFPEALKGLLSTHRE